jgi:hypothetical protein
MDANEIMPFNVRKWRHLAHLADHFRGELLFQRGGIWLDLDMVLNRPFDYTDDCVIGGEKEPDGSTRPVLVLKMPAGAPIMRWYLDRIKELDPDVCEWSDIMHMMPEGVNLFQLGDRVIPPEEVGSIPWWKVADFLKPRAAVMPLMYHLYHEMWRRESIPTNVFSGLYAELQAKYGSGSGRALIGFITCEAYAEKRELCLSTWARELPSNCDLKICTGEELGVSDDYLSLLAKTRELVRYACRQNYGAMLKCDDDTFMRADRLTIPDADYAGWLMHDTYPENSCSGGAYWLSRRALNALAYAEPPADPAGPEDRWVGHELKEVGIYPVQLENFTMSPNCAWGNWEIVDPTKQHKWSLAGDWVVMLDVAASRPRVPAPFHHHSPPDDETRTFESFCRRHPDKVNPK